MQDIAPGDSARIIIIYCINNEKIVIAITIVIRIVHDQYINAIIIRNKPAIAG